MLSKEGFCKALQMIKEQESIDEQFSISLVMVTLYSALKTSIYWLLEMF
mgnify:CR=1 FL=1